jgi:hypothetical protein
LEIKPITNSDIEKSKNNEEIVRLTILQVMKDFEQFGIPVSFPEDTSMAYDDLFDQLEGHIAQLIDTNLDRLYTLLYRIDVSDATIRKQQTIRYDLPLPHIITDLILQREFRKVLFRLYFKNQNKDNQ